jgi:large subunit ribosomal protein L29
MPSSKTRELHDMATLDLEDHLTSTQQELLNLRFQYATRQTENYARLRLLRREVARAKTILRERELAEL